MKRTIFFLIILFFLFMLSIILSLLLFPNWLTQSDWKVDLPRNILVASLLIIINPVISLLISNLLINLEIIEWIRYHLGNKYREVTTKLDSFSNFEISREKKSRKYIPNIFIETTLIKEKLRYFCEPNIFFRKIVEETDRQINDAYILNVLQKIHYPINQHEPFKLVKRHSYNKYLKDNISLYRKYLSQKRDITNILIKNGGIGLKSELISNIPADYGHIYGYIYANLQYYRIFESVIDEAERDLNLLTNKVLILKGLAGHGKTNLLCDFTDNFLLRKQHKCIYLPAKELNYIGEQETIEQTISRILFSGSNYQFLDILRLIKFNKRIDHLFIIIDGINEHKDLNLFSIALEQFIQRCSEYEIKIILTCRSEYYDDRYNNLSNIENCVIIDMDSPKYIHEIPNVHQCALITAYFSEFNIHLNLERVHPDIIQIFNKDKLLLRIFSEAYENDHPADYLDDLYKLEIFSRYYDKKKETISGLDSCLKEIIIWMIDHEEFSNIQITNFSEQSIKVVESIVYENVVIRKDIIVTPGIAFGKSEVINFVYDEFRDYLLASNILENWSNSHSLVMEQIRQFTDTRLSISEGLQKFICLWGIKYDQQDLLHFLSRFSWFNYIFTSAVTNSPNKYHTDFIISIIEQLFRSDTGCTLEIIHFLIFRTNIEYFPILNLDLLLKWMFEMDEVVYIDILSIALNYEEDYKTSYINQICSSILKVFREKRVSDQSAPKLIQLLCHFSGIRDLKFPIYRENGFYEYPAYDAILMMERLITRKLILEQVHLVLSLCRIGVVKTNLKRILYELNK